MKGDFSRSTFRPTNHYSSVRLQQGRVLLDAEWNEQADLDAHRERATTGDVIGPSGVPKHPEGSFEHFAVTLEADGSDLFVAPGRIYVDGILCEGDGLPTNYLAQPDLPGTALPGGEGAFAVYLDVWERHITPADQHGNAFPGLLETALGGPDTATRTRVVWQIKLLPLEVKECSAFAPPEAPTGLLRARGIPAPDPGSDCLVPATGGYRRLENQFYRVEIEAVAEAGTTFTWSRDNGSVVSKVRTIDAVARVIVIEDEDRDETHGFAGARWVELSDEERSLTNQRGAVFEVDSVTGTSITVKNPDNLSFAVGTNPTLRRWDGRVTAAAATPLELEDGVEIEIDGGSFVPTDHWSVPARTLTGAVEWPVDDSVAPPEPVFEPRQGVQHHYAVLAIVGFSDGAFSDVSDCRPKFPPLTNVDASDVGYDPSACDNLAGAATVQQALDILCHAAGEAEPGIRVQEVAWLTGDEFQNDVPVPSANLAEGIRITLGRPLFIDSVRNVRGFPNPVCRVTLDLPWPVTAPERDTWRLGNARTVGFQTITIAGAVDADGNQILWRPRDDAIAAWIRNSMVVVAQRIGDAKLVLGRLTVVGNFIWGDGPEGGQLFVDGDTFGRPGDGRTDARLPSGNGRRGGNLDLWFWLFQG